MVGFSSRHSRLPLLLGGLVAMGLVVGSQAAYGSGVTWVGEQLCEFPPGSVYGGFGQDAQPADSDGPAATFGQWLEGPGKGEALDALADIVAADPRALGWFRDHIEQQVVVTVDPSVGQPADLVKELQGAVGDAFEVVVRPGCFSRSELAPVAAAMKSHELEPPLLQSWELAATGRVLIDLCKPADEEAAMLEDRFGQKVDVRLLERCENFPAVGETATSAPTSSAPPVRTSASADRISSVEAGSQVKDESKPVSMPAVAWVGLGLVVVFTAGIAWQRWRNRTP